MSMSIEQYRKKQSQAPEGWVYLQDCYSKDELKRIIKIDDNNSVWCTLWYIEDFNKIEFHYTGKYKIAMNVALFHPNAGGLWCGNGLGVFNYSEPVYTRKAYKDLCEYAKEISDSQIMSIYNEFKDNKLVDGRII